jgi:hypothetical protein
MDPIPFMGDPRYMAMPLHFQMLFPGLLRDGFDSDSDSDDSGEHDIEHGAYVLNPYAHMLRPVGPPPVIDLTSDEMNIQQQQQQQQPPRTIVLDPSSSSTTATTTTTTTATNATSTQNTPHTTPPRTQQPFIIDLDAEENAEEPAAVPRGFSYVRPYVIDDDDDDELDEDEENEGDFDMDDDVRYRNEPQILDDEDDVVLLPSRRPLGLVNH